MGNSCKKEPWLTGIMMVRSGLACRPGGPVLFLFLFVPPLMEVFKDWLNVNGARDRGKGSLVLEYLEQNNIDVFFFARVVR